MSVALKNHSNVNIFFRQETSDKGANNISRKTGNIKPAVSKTCDCIYWLRLVHVEKNCAQGIEYSWREHVVNVYLQITSIKSVETLFYF